MPQEPSDRRRDGIVVALLVLLLSAVYFDVLFLGNNFFTRDLTLYHYPMKKVVRDTILDGQLPVWNSWASGGQPMAANPAYEVFYPPQWLTLIPDYNLGFRLHILVHVYLAAIGAFLFLRSRGARRAVAFIGGMAFVLGGPFVSVFNLLPFMFSVAWMPWIALFAGRYFESRLRRDGAALIFFLAMQALICEPTTLLQTWFVLGLWGAWQGWSRARSGPVLAAASGFAAAVGVVIAGVVLAAVQFLPALDHATDSVRRNAFPWETVAQWSFPPLRFVELLYPSFLGLVETGGPLYWGMSLYREWGGPYFFSVYLGLPFVALGLAGLITRKKGSGLVLATLATSAVLAMGSWTPALRLLYDAHMLPSIRYPEKFILMGAFVMLAWACLVLEDLLAGDRRVARVTHIVLAVSALAAAVMVAWSLSPGYDEWFTSFWQGSDAQGAWISRVHWLVAAIRGLAVIVALEIARRSKVRAAIAMLVMVVVADLAPLGNQVNPRMPRRFFDAPPAALRVAEIAGDSRMLHLGWLDRGTDRFNKGPGGYDKYWRLRNSLLPGLPVVWGVPTVLEWDVDETSLVHTTQFMNYVIAYMRLDSDEGTGWREDSVRQIAGMCNVGVVASIRDDDGVTQPGAEDREAYQPVDFEPIRGGPRYYFATEVVVVKGVQEMFERLVAREYPQAVAFMYEGGSTVAAGVVHSVREDVGTIELDVEALGDATVVASVTRHKYWSATVDGEPVEIRAVNHAFQGVRVPPGRHVVRWRYDNPLLPTGAAVTFSMMAGLVLGTWRGRRG